MFHGLGLITGHTHTHRAAEVDIIVTDLERANQRASSAEKELEAMLKQGANQFTTSTADKVYSPIKYIIRIYIIIY